MGDQAGDVTVSILVGRADAEFLRLTVSHLIRASRYNFARRLLIVDTLKPTRHQSNENLAGRNDCLLSECQRLRRDGIIDDVIELGSDPEFARTVSRKHFGKALREQRDFRGIPLLGWAYGIEKAQTDYVLHFDSDILLHQALDFNWIAEGVRLLRSASEIAFISPLPGPPTADGTLNQNARYTDDPRGFFAFKTFSSRRFLADRRRLNELLPLRPVYASTKRRLVAGLTGGSALWNWEVMMSNRLQESGLVRAHLKSPKAWTLHAPYHGPQFLAALPHLIEKVERGEFPPSQAGIYDLLLDEWT